MKQEENHNALLSAIELLGSQERLAKAMDVTQAAVSKWIKKGDGVPAERVVAAERAVGGRITREQFRPDLYAPRKKRGDRA